MKIFIVYDSKYGNTKKVAQTILEGLNQVSGIEAAIGYAKEVDPQTLADYNAFIIGAPNHMGKPSRTITKFADALAKTDPKAKWAAAFDTHLNKPRNYQKATKKLENHINKRFPNLTLITPGLSIKINGINGPIENGELPKAQTFGKQIATQLQQP